MIDTIALLASIETKYAVLGALSLVCAGSFAALYLGLKRNHTRTKDSQR